MTKLTNWDRDQLRTKLLKHRFDAQAQLFEKEEHALAQAVLDHLFDEKARALIKSLPPRWLPEVSSINVEFGSRYDRLQLGEMRPVPYKVISGTCATFAAQHPLSERYDALRQRREQHRADRTAADTEVKAALAAFTMRKNLLEDWPELLPFVQHWFDARAALPAVPLQRINELLNLPGKEVEKIDDNR